MQVWNVLRAAHWKYRTQKNRQKSPSRHHRTTLSGYIFAIKARIDNPASHRQRVLPSPCHPAPGCDAMVSSDAACSIRRTFHCALSMGMTQQFFSFPWWPLHLWPLTLTFELGRDFCTVHLTTKFHHRTFNRSEVIVLTNKQRDKQMPLKTPTSVRYATPVGNNFTKYFKMRYFFYAIHLR